jgi:hypothetical protein
LTSLGTVAIAGVTVLGGVLAFYVQASDFLMQRERQYELQLDQQLVTLVTQLNSETELVREGAVLLLSAYEADAIPILLWSLDRFREPDAIIQSLRLIDDKPSVSTDQILDPLLASAHEVLARGLDNAQVSDIRTLVNHIMALGEFGRADVPAAKEFLTAVTNHLEQADLQAVAKSAISQAVDRTQAQIGVSSNHG